MEGEKLEAGTLPLKEGGAGDLNGEQEEVLWGEV